MARKLVTRQLESLGGSPHWRQDFVTDNGNIILDIHDLEIKDAPTLEARINQITGVVCVGLFAHRGADVLLLGGDNGVRCIDK
jgi:ribose 5-phosphate isomerase A